MYSRQGIPKDSLKPHDGTQSSWYLFTWPHFSHPISIQYLISQSAFGIWLGHTPCGVHKPQYVPCSLHSDSNHQMDNKSHTQPLISSMSTSSSTHCISMYSRSPGTHFPCVLHQQYSTRRIHLHLQGKLLHLSGRLRAHSAPLIPGVNTFFPFQMAALNFKRILLMLKDVDSIPRDTLQSQDGLNLGDICFCPLIHTLHMQCPSLDGLCTLLAKGAFMPPRSERPPN